jgi:hypothetical protein
MDMEIEKEILIRNNLREPHFSYAEDSVLNKKKASILMMHKSNDEVLLVDSYGFNFDSIFAGLTERHIEYIAKSGPKNYKDNIMKILKDQEMMKGVFEIAKALDDDAGRNVTDNQERIRNVIQYIKDNRVVFEF